MDNSKIVEVLSGMTDEELEAAADELHAFVAHRRTSAGKPNVQRAPFNAGKFFANFLKVINAIGPVIGPLLGADAKEPSKA